MNGSIESQVRALIAATLHVDQARVGRDATFSGDLGADSLDLVSLILTVEDEFQIDIHDEDAAEILTVEDMIEYVNFAVADEEPLIVNRSNGPGAIGLR